MALDGLRAYVQLANGLTEVTRARATAAARALIDQNGGAVAGQVRQQVATMAEELITTSRANRELIVSLVDSEVERVAARLGLVAQEQLDRMTERAERLERRVRELEIALGDRVTPAAAAAAPRVPAKRSTRARAGRPDASTAGESKAASAAADEAASSVARRVAANEATARAVAAEPAEPTAGPPAKRSAAGAAKRVPTRTPAQSPKATAGAGGDAAATARKPARKRPAKQALTDSTGTGP